MTTTVLAYIPSPSQGVWHLGPFPLRAYALFIIVGIIAALVIGDRRWVARGGEPGVIYDVALWAVPFGLIGGRLYHVITDWPTYFGDGGAGPAAALRIWDGGLGIWGAVAFGGIGAWIACRRRGIPLPAFGDAIAPGIVLAQAIGRLGNYFNQELFGRETTVPWGLEIYERVNAAGLPDSLNGVSNGELIQVVHPTFLYELLWNLLVFAVLILVDRRFKIGHGRLFALYVAGYCVGRFWIELMRSDTATLLAGIRVNSFTATFVFIGAVVYIMAAPKGREDPASLTGNQDAEAGVEELAKDVAVGSATGIVAAAKVADEDEDMDSADDDAAEVEALVAELEASEPETEGLGSVEGDEVAEAVEVAPEVHEGAVEGEAEAEELAADAGGAPEPEGVEAAEVEAESEVAEAADVEAESPVDGVEDESEAESEAVEGDVESVTGSEGLGSVEADEVAEAVEVAPEVHEGAVEGEAEAEELAADAEGAPEPEAVEAAEVEAESEVAEAADVEAESPVDGVGDESEAESEAVEGDVESVTGSEGLGSVEADEVAEVHEGAVEGEAEAEELAADAEGAPEPEGVEAAEVEAESEVAEAADVEAESPVDGVGDESEAESEAVEGDVESVT
ncbi:prolipoprotein diacylglyceryl transferase, partial [Mycolicibacterium austroafricanum]|uniref:prolipoprotein diacylglyceryl transferase n=1 Tax=Mycolicibacterium austroafricanum TaxID=39687 RepID=UPI001F26EF95